MKALVKLLSSGIFLLVSLVSSAQVEFTETLHDYGTIKKGAKFYSEFTFTNNTKEKVYLLRASTPASNDSASIGAFTVFDVYSSAPYVMPGEQGSIKVYFEIGKPGKFKALIKVYFSSEIDPILLGVSGRLKKVSDDPDMPCYSFDSKSKEGGQFVSIPTFKANVKNEYNEYIPGATVFFRKEGKLRNVAYTAEDGSLTALIYEGNYDITIIAPKHDTLYTKLFISADQTNNKTTHTFVLKKGAGELLSVDEYANNNVVFLLDISASMNDPEKLPKLKESLKLLVSKLRERDFISIVTYADKAALALPPVKVSEANKPTIYEIIDKLTAGGQTSTNQGLELAYELAKKFIIADGNNQLILVTDGDFKLSAKDQKIISENNSKIILTTVGYGLTQENANNLSELAVKGKGHFINADEAQKPDEILLEEIKKNSKR